jgi:hypothetical protein
MDRDKPACLCDEQRGADEGSPMGTRASLAVAAIVGLFALTATAGKQAAGGTAGASECIASKKVGLPYEASAALYFASGSPRWVVRRLCRRARAAGFRGGFVSGEKLLACRGRMKSHPHVRAGLYGTTRSARDAARGFCPRWLPKTHWIRLG